MEENYYYYSDLRDYCEPGATRSARLIGGGEATRPIETEHPLGCMEAESRFPVESRFPAGTLCRSVRKVVGGFIPHPLQLPPAARCRYALRLSAAAACCPIIVVSYNTDALRMLYYSQLPGDAGMRR